MYIYVIRVLIHVLDIHVQCILDYPNVDYLDQKAQVFTCAVAQIADNAVIFAEESAGEFSERPVAPT